MTHKITMDAIAKSAAVSKYAVSKALSGQSGVSEATRERIMRVAHDLGYFAQSRVQRKYDKTSTSSLAKQSIMVLMPNIRQQNMDSNYWGRIIDGIAEELRKDDLSMMIATEHTEENLHALLNIPELLGLIVVGTVSTVMLSAIEKMKIPYVLVDHEDPSLPCDTLFVNNLDGATRATKHLIDCGHESLQFVGNLEFARSFQERFLGFRTVMEGKFHGWAQHDPLLHIDALLMDTTLIQLRNIFADMLRAGTLPTGLVCANDDIALSALKALQSLDLTVPDRVSVIGFDNIDRSEYSEPPLTTINVAKEALGRRAVEMLLRRHRHREAMIETVLLHCELIHRESCSRKTTPVSVSTT